MKNIKSYLTIITEDQSGGFNVNFPEFPGCYTCGETLEGANENAKEALGLWLESLESKKDSGNNFEDQNKSFITFTQPILS